LTPITINRIGAFIVLYKVSKDIKQTEKMIMENYKAKIKAMSNKDLDAEFRQINIVRNLTDNDYEEELECLENEFGWRQREPPNEIDSERISLHANDFNGYVNWVQYDFVDKYLLVNHRLSDVVVIHAEVPRSEYHKLKNAEFEEDVMKEFEGKFKGEEL
jgi:hypothetical protein